MKKLISLFALLVLSGAIASAQSQTVIPETTSATSSSEPNCNDSNNQNIADIALITASVLDAHYDIGIEKNYAALRIEEIIAQRSSYSNKKIAPPSSEFSERVSSQLDLEEIQIISISKELIEIYNMQDGTFTASLIELMSKEYCKTIVSKNGSIDWHIRIIMHLKKLILPEIVLALQKDFSTDEIRKNMPLDKLPLILEVINSMGVKIPQANTDGEKGEQAKLSIGDDIDSSYKIKTVPLDEWLEKPDSTEKRSEQTTHTADTIKTDKDDMIRTLEDRITYLEYKLSKATTDLEINRSMAETLRLMNEELRKRFDSTTSQGIH